MSNFLDKARLPEEVEFEERIKASKNFKIVKFGADWCEPCKEFTEEINEKIKGVDGVEYHDLQISTKPGITESYITYCYNLKIASLPRVFILSPDNEILGDYMGEDSSLFGVKVTLEQRGIKLNGE
jgi:hypothetical protein